MPTNHSCRCCGSSHLPRRCPAYGKKCAECSKINHFRDVCRSGRNRTVHNLNQEPDQPHEEVYHIDTVNINSVYFSNKHLVIKNNLKSSSNQASIIVIITVIIIIIMIIIIIIIHTYIHTYIYIVLNYILY